MSDVTKQPEMQIINKYLGFEQLNFLQENNIDCVLAKEIYDIDNNFLLNSNKEDLWSVRVATLIGQDFDLPSKIGVDKHQALKWMKEQRNKEERYVFMCSKYFNAYKSGRIHIEKNKITIEMSVGGFDDFKHSIPNLVMVSLFNMSFNKVMDDHMISESYVWKLIDLSQRLQRIYSDVVDNSYNVVYEFDFAFGCFMNKIGISSADFLKIVSMRSYNLNQKHEIIK